MFGLRRRWWWWTRESFNVKFSSFSVFSTFSCTQEKHSFWRITCVLRSEEEEEEEEEGEENIKRRKMLLKEYSKLKQKEELEKNDYTLKEGMLHEHKSS